MLPNYGPAGYNIFVHIAGGIVGGYFSPIDKPAEFTIYKVDEGGEPVTMGLTQNTFELSTAPDFTNITTATPSGNAFLFCGLRLGRDYYLRENTPRGFIENTAVYRVLLEAAEGSVLLSVCVQSGDSPNFVVIANEQKVTVTNIRTVSAPSVSPEGKDANTPPIDALVIPNTGESNQWREIAYIGFSMLMVLWLAGASNRRFL